MQVASVEEYVRVVLTKMNGTDNDDRGAVFRDRPSALLHSSRPLFSIVQRVIITKLSNCCLLSCSSTEADLRSGKSFSSFCNRQSANY